MIFGKKLIRSDIAAERIIKAIEKNIAYQKKAFALLVEGDHE